MKTVIRFAYETKEHHAFSMPERQGYLYVTGVDNGVVTVEAPKKCSIENFKEIVEACFAPGTNFRRELRLAMNLKPKASVESVKCIFNGKYIGTLNRGNAWTGCI